MASESDAFFAQLESEMHIDPYLEFKIEGDQLSNRPDPRTTVPLASREDDPFYRAQMCQRTLDAFIEPQKDTIRSPLTNIGATSLKSFLIKQTLEELNSNRWRPVFDQRLALSAFMLSMEDRQTHKATAYQGDVIVAGHFREFEHAMFNGHDTLVALFSDPRFIDPDAVNAAGIARISVPVLGINDWNYSGI